MIRIVLISCFISLYSALYAQTEETEFKKSADSIIRAEFPRARMFNIDYNQSGGRDFESEFLGNAYQKGHINQQETVTISTNIPLAKTKKWTLTGSATYKYVEYEFNALENTTPMPLFEQHGVVNFHNFSTAVSSTYFSKLFGKLPVIYNASIIADGSNNGFERVKGLIGASLILKRNATTSITLGTLVFLDPTAQIPFSPTFTYNHKFKNSSWEFDFILPQRILLRRPISTKGRLSIGSEFGSNGFYVNVKHPNYPSVFEYSQLEINNGLTYEHKLTNSIYATVKGGITTFVSNRLTEKGEPSKEYIYNNKQDPTGYFNIGLSINPFNKKKK